tara:strand:- start:3532 stop:4245 length:714 start_codon:yes stop_codon:yes gene_type:complete
MAFDVADVVDVVALNVPGKRHTLEFTCSGTQYVLIKKMWIDNISANLTNIDSPYLSSIGVYTFPKMKWFPFFFDPLYTLEGCDEIPFNPSSSQESDDFEYLTFPNISNGLITHPLSDFSFNGFFTGFNVSGYLTTSIRDNYRLNKMIKIKNYAGTSDKFTINVLFCTNVIDNYSGVLNIIYDSIPYTGPSEIKTKTIYLEGAINNTNVSEIDYTSISVVSEIEGVDLTNPFISIELG